MLFAYRATDPEVMKEMQDPVGPLNDWVLVETAKKADLVVAAWGRHGIYKGRAEQVRKLLKDAGVLLRCLKLNIDGSPQHPLYLRKNLLPVPYSYL